MRWRRRGTAQRGEERCRRARAEVWYCPTDYPLRLPLAVWSEFGDLPVLIDGDDRVRVNLGTHNKIVSEPGLGQRPAVGRFREELIDSVAVPLRDQLARPRPVV